ncbi:MAG: hypothetical protein MJK04_17545 [Psychrosphaera sp.]|nr:hypothetical protein [Psychrosphaera sp.]
MYKLFLVLTLIFMTGCTTSPRNYFNFTLSASEEVLVASDLAWLIKEKHGAAATFEFDYPMWSRSTSFSQALEIALRKQGLAVYVKNINEENPVAKTHNELYYTLDTLNDGQLYIRVMVNDRFSFQRIWLRDHNEILRPLATTSVFEGVSGE